MPATPMPSATQVVAALRREGLTVVELPGFARHNRNGGGRRWGPSLLGVTVHHTAGATVRGSAARSYAGGILWRGVNGLPGPLCQIGLDTDGVVYMTGWGRANHAGSVDPAAITAMVNGTITRTGNRPPGSDRVDGNAQLVGIECMTSAPFSPQMTRAVVLITAAFHRLCGWPASTPRLIGHRELTRRKPEDPRMTVGRMREAVVNHLRTGGTTTPSKPAPAPETGVLGMTEQIKPRTDHSNFDVKPGATVSVAFGKGVAVLAGPLDEYTLNCEVGVSGLRAGEISDAHIDQLDAQAKVVRTVSRETLNGGDEWAKRTLTATGTLPKGHHLRLRVTNRADHPIRVEYGTVLGGLHS